MICLTRLDEITCISLYKALYSERQYLKLEFQEDGCRKSTKYNWTIRNAI